MKRLLIILALFGCKHEQPQPEPTSTDTVTITTNNSRPTNDVFVWDTFGYGYYEFTSYFEIVGTPVNSNNVMIKIQGDTGSLKMRPDCLEFNHSDLIITVSDDYEFYRIDAESLGQNDTLLMNPDTIWLRSNVRINAIWVQSLVD